MPLLFVIAGMGAWYSLRSRTLGAFARERLRRLGVPLLAGLLTLVPLQVYLGQRRAGDAGPGAGRPPGARSPPGPLCQPGRAALLRAPLRPGQP